MYRGPRNARHLAEGLAQIEGIAADPQKVQTNIVLFDLRQAARHTATAVADACAALKEHNVLCSPTARFTVRMVTHYDVDRGGIDQTVEAARVVMAGLVRAQPDTGDAPCRYNRMGRGADHRRSSRRRDQAMRGLRAFVVQVFALAVFVAAMSTPADTSQSTVSAEKRKRRATHGGGGAEIRADAAEKQLLDLWIKDGRAQWVHETYITDDTEQMAADADEAVATVTAELAAQARRFDKLKLPEDVARKLMLLRLSVSIPTPRDPALAAELTKINTSLDGDYGKGKWCPDGPMSGKCLALGDIEPIIAHSRDPQELLRAWKGWHAIAPPMRQRYTRMVTLANQGARELGFADVGAMWRSNYDVPPEEFSAEVDRLWQQVRPLYVSLHTYVRWQLAKKYGPIGCEGRRAYPRAPTRKYVGAGLDEHLPAGGAGEC